MAVSMAIGALSLVVMGMGFLPMVCVALLSVALTCHPTVREYIELALPCERTAQIDAKREHNVIEVLRSRVQDMLPHTRRHDAASTSPERCTLASLPPACQSEAQHILRLVRRDCIQYWFDPISFGLPTFPDEAIAAAEHVLAQIALRLEQYSRTTVATELSLTALSVIVTAMQNKRSEDAPSPGLWDNASARIESLQTSMSTLLRQTLPEEDRHSPMVVALLSELVSKQLWTLLQTYSDPDVLNGYILQYGRLPEQRLTYEPRTKAPKTPAQPTASHDVQEALRDLDAPSGIKSPSSSLPDHLEEMLSELRESSLSQDEPSEETEQMLPVSDTAEPAVPMNIPPDVKEPPLPRSLETSRLPKETYKVRYPKKVGDVLNNKDSDTYDDWYSFLSRLDPTLEPPEGAVLIQLHSNLEALDESASHEASSSDLYASDVRTVVQASLAILPETSGTKGVRTAMAALLKADDIQPNMVKPLRKALLKRLQTLYDMFVAEARGKTVAHTSPSRSISVVDVSTQTKPDRPVDPRSMQVLVTVEAGEKEDAADGYAVLRSWPQFEALQADLVRMYERRPLGSNMSRPPALPLIRGLTSAAACQAIQTYLEQLLSPSSDGMAWYTSTQPVHSFLDKTRASTTDEETRMRTNAFMSGLGGVGRTFATGFAGAAGSARKGMGQRRPAPSRAGRVFGLRPDMTDAVPIPPSLPPRHTSVSPQDKASSDAPQAAETAAESPEPVEASQDDARPSAAHTESRDMDDAPSMQDVNALLTAVFAVTREALNMHEAWTLRRGMLRVIEQFIRSTYLHTVSDVLAYFSSKLATTEQASWLRQLRETCWPHDTWNTASTPARTPEEMQKRADEARAIVLSYTPPQAAYALGIGGKQAVMDALGTVHQVVTDPMVSLDLHLALLLRVMDLAVGTASGSSG